MNSLPPYTFLLIILSCLISTACLILGALILPLTPVLWTIPGAFLLTVVYHFVLVLLSNAVTDRSKRLFSTLTVGGAYLLTLLWAGVLAISITFAVFLAQGKVQPVRGSPKINPILITMSGFAFFHPFILFTIGVILHKERRQEQYREKWKWKTQTNTSNWSVGQDH